MIGEGLRLVWANRSPNTMAVLYDRIGKHIAVVEELMPCLVA